MCVGGDMYTYTYFLFVSLVARNHFLQASGQHPARPTQEQPGVPLVPRRQVEPRLAGHQTQGAEMCPGVVELTLPMPDGSDTDKSGSLCRVACRN